MVEHITVAQVRNLQTNMGMSDWNSFNAQYCIYDGMV